MDELIGMFGEIVGEIFGSLSSNKKDKGCLIWAIIILIMIVGAVVLYYYL